MEKSVPELQGNQTQEHLHTSDENRSDCVKCKRRNGDETMVQCDNCQTWWHFTCAGVTGSITDRSWSCVRCQAEDRVSISSRSSRTNRTGKSSKVQLQLEKLYELQELEKKYVEEKYKLLEAQLEQNDEHENENKSARSRRSRVSKQTSLTNVANWVNNCAVQTEDNHVRTSTDKCLPQWPPGPSNLLKPNAAPASSRLSTQGQQPTVETQHSPLKHPSLPNQRSASKQLLTNPAVGEVETVPSREQVGQVICNRITNKVPLAQSTPSQVPPTEQVPLQCVVTTSIATPVTSHSSTPPTAPVYSLPPVPTTVDLRASTFGFTATSLLPSTVMPVNVAGQNIHSNSVPFRPVPSQGSTVPTVSGHTQIGLPPLLPRVADPVHPPHTLAYSGPVIPRSSISHHQFRCQVESAPCYVNAPILPPTTMLPPAATDFSSSAPFRHSSNAACSPVYHPDPAFIPLTTVESISALPPAIAPISAAATPLTSAFTVCPAPLNREVSFPEPPGKPNNCPLQTTNLLPADDDGNLQHLMRQFGSIALAPSQSPLLNTNLATFAPSPSQLAARQVMPRDLPPFSGDPAAWPVFISSFINTTLACGYSSAENLCRLQRSLKGPAYEAVQSRLLLPESVPHIIETLHLLYGRPELLISALLDKVRSAPSPKMDKFQTIIDFGMSIQSLCDHLEVAGQTAHLSNPSLLAELVAKLPPNLQMDWGSHLEGFSEVNLKTFGSFMSSVVKAVSKVTVYASSSGRSSAAAKNNLKPRGSVNTHQFDSKTSVGNNASTIRDEAKACPACKNIGHRIQDCRTFKSLAIDGRWKCVQLNGLCRYCLAAHGRRSCRKAGKCGINGCELRHHPLLHSSRNNTESQAQPRTNTAENYSHRQLNQSLLFRILPVTLHGPKGTVDTFAFLDDGSSLTLIEDSLAEELGVEGVTKPLCLLWTSNVSREVKNSREMSLIVSSSEGKRYPLEQVHSVNQLTLPTQTLSYQQISKQYAHLKGLPIVSYIKASPKLLIGLNNLNLMVPLKIREGLRREPVATKTRLGWCIYGGGSSCDRRPSVNFHACGCASTSDQVLHDLVKNFFATDDVGVQPSTQLVSEGEKRAQRILEKTTVRVGTHFETGLLWKFDHFELPDSYNMALRRLECLERRMNRKPELKQALQRQVEDYQTKGYAHRATQQELASADMRRIWYLPLGVVENPRKPGKIRMIWDARAAVNGISLNSALLKGPDQLTSLPGVLLRFRQFQVGVSSDIREMFHQILIRKEDRHSQRFLWRNDPSETPVVYLMDVATFGSTCSPASAQYIKNKNANEFKEQYARAVQGIVKNHYVDDSLESYESVEEAIKVSQEMRFVHEQGGFELRNWRSNSSAVLNAMGEPKPEEDKTFAADKESGYERVLGLLWLTQEDAFSFSTHMKLEIAEMMNGDERPTKRQMLRCLMSLFDPLGLISHFVVQGKILLQDVWREGLQWDEKVNDDLHRRWKNWTSLLEAVHKLKVPRCYFFGATKERYHDLQLHVFVDASESAYCAAAYFRTLNDDGQPECTLVAAKTKVTPLKTQSIPRLELLAAVLGARLSGFVEENHTLRITRKVFWSDSATVLSWLRADHRRYKQFVACRIGELLTITDVRNWRWVPSKQNPADMATKWGNGPDLTASSIWFEGPSFLRLTEEEWPTQRLTASHTEEELRPCYVHCAMPIPKRLVEVERFSQLTRAVRAVAYVYRFVENLKRTTRRQERHNGPLESEELQRAESLLIREAQWQCFPDEMVVLNLNRLKAPDEHLPLAKCSILYQLCPFLDELGILRVDSRIRSAPNVEKEAKFPAILPRKSAFTALLLDSYHRRFLHGNTETVVNEVRQRYYIPRLRTMVNSVAKACQWCRIYKCTPRVPRMAPLPLARMASFVRPFTYTGLDFFGPLTVKIGRSNAKRWIALFTCLTVRAVHVEVAHNLSTDSCIKGIRRFICRRGLPAEIYSDNGTNFLGASKLLKDQIEQLADTFTGTATKWVFNPPGTPHMGGAWERMVRSIKTAVEAAYNNNRKLDDEALETFMVEAEAIVNSRPLTYLPLTSEEDEALTPNHFLLGNSSGVRQPAVKPTDPAEALRSSWAQVQHQLDVFWNRWIREYLPTLTKRPKWCGEVKPLAEGQLVIVVNEGSRNEWTRGRVVQVIQGADGRIRQAMIQTVKGIVRRPVARLAVLDVDVGSKTGPGGQCYGGEDVITGSTAGHDTVTTNLAAVSPVKMTRCRGREIERSE